MASFSPASVIALAALMTSIVGCAQTPPCGVPCGPCCTQGDDCTGAGLCTDGYCVPGFVCLDAARLPDMRADADAGSADISDACPRLDACHDVCGDGVCTVDPCCRTETCATCPGDCCPETLDGGP